MVEIWRKLSDYEIHICFPAARPDNSISLFRARTPFSRGPVSWSNGRANKVGAVLLSWAWSPLPRVQYSNSWQLLGCCLVDMTLSIYTTLAGKVSVWSKLSSVLRVACASFSYSGSNQCSGCMPPWTAPPLLLVLHKQNSDKARPVGVGVSQQEGCRKK